MRHLIRLLIAHHDVVRVKAHLWVSAYDGEGWKSAYDAAVHVLAHIITHR